ncbi:MAG: hypothetical protein WC709_12475 [Thermoleophilia bacterium]
MLLFVALAGAVGGVVNALLSDGGFRMPGRERATNATILRPGWIGNVLVGAVAAAVSWGLYGPLAAYYVAGTSEALAANTEPETIGLALSSLVGAVLIGVGGARWLTNEVDKNLLKATASMAATAQGTGKEAEQIALASPLQAFNIAKGMS